jgi:hypothetical protein
MKNWLVEVFKNSTMILALGCTVAFNAQAKPEDLSFPFGPNSGDYWQYVSDRTMGGVSNGKVTLEEEQGVYYVRLTGDVSTRNNGGFIQLRTGISFANTAKEGQSISGAKLTAKGNGEVYHVFIRTKDNWSYSDYYYATFTANNDWQLVDLPFKDFKRSRSQDTKLLAEDITRFAIVGYGRDFKADVSVSNVSFYY